MTGPRSIDLGTLADHMSNWWNADGTHARLLAEASHAFDVDFDPATEPREVYGVRCYGISRLAEGCHVVFVTGGGLKISWPLDEGSEERLRNVFKRFKKRRDQRTGEEIVETLPLPTDLALPEVHRHGIPPAR